jgi:hypothetical protein
MSQALGPCKSLFWRCFRATWDIWDRHMVRFARFIFERTNRAHVIRGGPIARMIAHRLAGACLLRCDCYYVRRGRAPSPLVGEGGRAPGSCLRQARGQAPRGRMRGVPARCDAQHPSFEILDGTLLSKNRRRSRSVQHPSSDLAFASSGSATFSHKGRREGRRRPGRAPGASHRPGVRRPFTEPPAR